MPEYFDISLILEKSDKPLHHINDYLFDKFGISRTESKNEYFGNYNTVLTEIYTEDEAYNEIFLGIAEYVFHKESFEEELNKISFFINSCFEYCDEIQFAVCIFELTGYYLGPIKEWSDFNDEFLNKFPISFKREGKQKTPVMKLNLAAQDIFTTNPFKPS